MGLFKKKIKIDSKFQKGDFVSFHKDKDLKVGIIKDVKLLNGNVVYDINVVGECPSLAKDKKEDKILKN